MNYFDTTAGQNTMERIAQSLEKISEKMEISQSRERIFAVCILADCVRNAQYFDTADMSDEEFAERDFYASVYKDRWHYMFHLCALVDITKAASADAAIKKVAQGKKCDKRMLYAFEVK